MRVVTIGLALVLAQACETEVAMPPTTDFSEADVSEDVSQVTERVSIDLQAGYMTASGHFIEKSNEVEVPPGGAWGYTQVGARLDVPDHLDPDLLRVIFSSDRIEWIGTSVSGETYVFSSEEECIRWSDLWGAALQCDDIIPGASESGYFKTGASFDERLAVTNVHCTPHDLPYDLTIIAFVIDISYPIAEIVSESEHLTIDCLEQTIEE